MNSAAKLVKELKKRGLHIAFVESCTGGALASALTDVEGASEVLEDSTVTYSNEAKRAFGVNPATIEHFGVYSEECAIDMAQAGVDHSHIANVGVGVTGSFGRVDPANPEGSIPGEVFVGFWSCATYVSFKLILTHTARTRKESKIYVKNEVFERLIPFLVSNDIHMVGSLSLSRTAC